MYLLIGLILVAGFKAFASKETVQESRNRAIITKGFEAWQRGTGNLFDLLTADADWTITGNAVVSKTYKTKQEFMDAVITPFNARMSRRLIPSVRGIYVDGDMVIALFEAEGIALDGKVYRNTYTWYMKMQQGQIVSVIAFFDTIEFMDLWKRIPLN